MRFQSNAFNFSSFLNGGVDARTGQYNCRIKLATIAPEGPSGASREIGIAFSMMEERDTGYGLGWTLSQSEYDDQTRRLRLISGDSYINTGLPLVGDLFTFRDKKLKNMAMRRVLSDVLHVIHSDGVIEVLTRRRDGPLFSLTQLIFENGERFDFSYTPEDFLQSIRNAQSGREILRLHYNNRLISQAHVLQERNRIAIIHWSTLNNQVSSISLPVDASASPSARPSYTFAYQSINSFLCLSRLSNPLGGVDQISYEANGHHLTNDQSIPFVTHVTSFGGTSNASHLVHQYSYSQPNNFTGSPFVQFDPDFDNIYVRTSEYNYSCTDRVLDTSGAIVQQTVSTFNRFHLQTSTETIRAGTRHRVSYTYNEDPNRLSFADQPANLQLPSRIVNRFELISGGASREEVETIVTDDFGNTRSHTYATGIRHEFDYYPVNGQLGRCPPEPHGLFQRFISTKRVVPAAGGSLAPKVTDYTYTYIAGLASNVNFILFESSTYAGQLTERAFYSASTTAALHGLPSYTQSTINNATTRTDFSYTLSGDLLTENTQINGYDGKRITMSKTSSVVNGLVVSIGKNNSITTEWFFDVNGRMVQETVSPGTVSAATRRYTYHFAAGGAWPRQEVTDALGGQYITYFDGFGRITTKHQRKSGSEELLERNSYNRLGQLESRTIVDRIDNVEHHMTTSYRYDGWGIPNRVTRADGSVLINEFNPITRTMTQGVENAGSIRIYLNSFDKVGSSEQVATNNQTLPVITRTYDGFGRCTSETNVNNLTEHYSYDTFDRIASKTFSGPGASRTTNFSYASHLVEYCRTSIRVDGIEVGSAVYDGLGRTISARRGGASAVSTSYLDNSLLPESIRSPGGITQTFQYHTQLDSLISTSIGGQSNSFVLDAKTGALISSTSSDCEREINVDEYGRIRSDLQRIQGQSYSNMYTYSRMGRLTSLQSALGDTETVSYDKFGRFLVSQSTANGTPQTSVEYDSAGRLSAWTVSVAGQTSKTALSFDAFGRESSRNITKNNSPFQTISYTYRSDNKLATRTTTNTSPSGSASEAFGYDIYGRLINYTCSGTQYPVDQYDHPIRAQTFIYDALDNLIRVDTTFTDSSSDTCLRSFAGSDPTRPSQISHTNPARKMDLSYDASGNLISDGTNTYTYNGFGKLISVTRASNISASYGYDAGGRQIRLSDGDGNMLTCHYSRNRLIGMRQASTIGRHSRLGASVVSRSMSNNTSSEIFSDDSTNNIRSTSSASNTRYVHYAPYGSSNIDTGSGSLIERSRPGFNGQRVDPMTRLYHLGNGRRAYSPDLMMFLTPDPTSPFDIGGINSYGYCSGDPINFHDPSGLSARPHWSSWLLWTLGAATALVMFAPIGKAILVGQGLAAVSLLGTKTVATVGAMVASSAFTGASLSIAEIDAARGTDNGNLSSYLMIAGSVLGIAAFGSLVTGGVKSPLRLVLKPSSRTENIPLRNYADSASHASIRGNGVYNQTTVVIAAPRPATSMTAVMVRATPYAYSGLAAGLALDSFVTGLLRSPETGTPEDIDNRLPILPPKDTDGTVPILPPEDPDANPPVLPPEDPNNDIPAPPPEPCYDPVWCFPYTAQVDAIQGAIENMLRFDSIFRWQALRLRASAIFDV